MYFKDLDVFLKSRFLCSIWATRHLVLTHSHSIRSDRKAADVLRLYAILSNMLCSHHLIHLTLWHHTFCASLPPFLAMLGLFILTLNNPNPRSINPLLPSLCHFNWITGWRKQRTRLRRQTLLFLTLNIYGECIMFEITCKKLLRKLNFSQGLHHMAPAVLLFLFEHYLTSPPFITPSPQFEECRSVWHTCAKFSTVIPAAWKKCS